MTVRLRLQRQGRPKRPYYRLVAIDKRVKRDGKPIEVLGQYDPMAESEKIKVDRARIDYWLKKGAQPSPTVASLLRKSSKSADEESDISQTPKEESIE